MHAVSRPTEARSTHWPKARREHLLRQPACAACGGTEHLEVHHIHPYHLFPDRELDQANLITLCEGPCNCHLTFGHLHSWQAYNPGVRADVEKYFHKLKHRPTEA